MVPDAIGSILLFALVAVGLGWPLASRLSYSTSERVLVTVAVSLLVAFFISWTIYIASLPQWLLWCLPIGAGGSLLARSSALQEIWHDRDVRELIGAQVVVTAWCIGWLALVGSYSGGGWTGDWFEHWERARFFLERWPHDTQFIHQYSLTARPPLANVLTATFLYLSRGDFSHFQLFSTVLASLTFLPAALLAQRWGGTRTVWICAGLVMLNPMFIQNTTFAWTKLPAAFFVLSAVYFFISGTGTIRSTPDLLLFSACLAGGLLTHYSAGPYALAFAAVWIVYGWGRRNNIAWWKQTTRCVICGGSILTVWFGWSMAVFGAGGTFLSNTSVQTMDASLAEQLETIGRNIGDTLVPHFMRPLDLSLMIQQSSIGRLRDWFFHAYQLNLFLACGSVAWAAILRTLILERTNQRAMAAVVWMFAVVLVIVLGIAVHSGRDTWGLAHICLQPLIIMAIAFLAARWQSFGALWRRAVLLGGVIDLVFGILLHYLAQSLKVDEVPGRELPPSEITAGYNWTAVLNFDAKTSHSLDFFSDSLGTSLILVFGLLGSLLLLTTLRIQAGTRPPDGRGSGFPRQHPVSLSNPTDNVAP